MFASYTNIRLILVRPMRTRLALTLVIAVAAVIQAGENSVEVTLEDTPEHHETPRWKFTPGQSADDRDQNGFMQWRYKFYVGSDKQLGTAADTAAIKALVPLTMPPKIRWISRSVVVVAADCYTDASSRGRVRCLYVLERHGSKWKLTHHYSRSFVPIIL